MQLSQAQAQLVNIVRAQCASTIPAAQRKRVCITYDCNAGVVISATVAQVQQLVKNTLQQLDIVVDISELATACSTVDTQINFVYAGHDMYVVSCYTN